MATDKRKNVYSELISNAQIAIGAYNLRTEKWIRIHAKAIPENSIHIKEEMMNTYPALKQKYQNETELFLAIFKLQINDISIT